MAALVLLLVNVALLVWLRFYYFVLFFVIYIAGTLVLNLAWKRGWKGIAPPLVYEEE
jgi:CDP-diacylglycerol--serine O-phosphatidyltransferase